MEGTDVDDDNAIWSSAPLGTAKTRIFGRVGVNTLDPLPNI